ncbi:ABC transporter ATP-binding protein [Rhodoplanes sp. TEM]|uniref:ABC transporter ATP-binding protein n=1 Tax=Rhodoplanes tepidamans TaxID=200616 RepID=A0ABT5J8R1_RHOTP|nr:MULTISPECIES: ABC transporter ATP-binding protein [Rhodoplanes]MDC7785883.1 ABC transporter ATP-binding protein [Rhodoplanes tepidamans]MDC7984995.1 ABC transporter ATP-binding protein [Rhodoplanes sp. TEM]MDQ0355499.1 iron complex transport system ATP-binding protein [Rhodoplanes tepidamans]
MSPLVADDVTVERRGARLLAGTSLALPNTGSVAIVGPNGAGKSTLLRVLAGQTAPTSGTVLLGDRPLAAVPARERGRLLGYVPQHFSPHWDLSVTDLVRLGVERGGAPSITAIDAAIESNDLVTLRRRRWSALSGGERARVLLAMVLAVDPPILLADEPGASLDIRHRMALVEMLAARGRERLCVVVMHDLDLAFRCFERIVLLDRGRLVADAPADALFEDRRLDAAFGVAFVRLATEHGRLLQAAGAPTRKATTSPPSAPCRDGAEPESSR